MANYYRPLNDLGRHLYGDGDLLELELSAVEEADALGNGLLAINPRPYQVCSSNYEGGRPGEVVTLALRKEVESALVGGGHLKRIETSAKAEEKGAKPATSTRKKG